MLAPESSFFSVIAVYGIAISLLILAVPIAVQTLINSIANIGALCGIYTLATALLPILLSYGALSALRVWMAEPESKVRFVSWTQFGQLLGAFSIPGSLFLVAWGMKQSREIAESELYFGRTNFKVAAYDHSYQMERIQAIPELQKKGNIADLSAEAYYLLWTEEHRYFAGLNTAQFHWQPDLINDKEWPAPTQFTYLERTTPRF